MLEPPSPQLLRWLRELRICSPAELRACRRRVRLLAGDLPAFDSVWIDALVQARKLTPFQAKILESPQPDSLQVGPCVLLGRLGQGLAASTYLARQRDGRERCVLKLIDAPAERAAGDLARVRELIARSADWEHPSIVVPHACRRWDRETIPAAVAVAANAYSRSGRVGPCPISSRPQADQLVVISRYISGPHLGELMVRRGRFAPSVVSALAQQLIDGLAELEARGLVHGGIHLPNVRLTDSGTAVLVDAGLAPALAPELTIHSERPPDRYDGVAAELIGTGNPPNSVSDIYALGCLMWQLLAGRPPFPTGDPLDKLVAHQTRTIRDIREWSPDTPSALADEIARFTSRRPEDRPQSFAELRERWGRPRRSGRKRLARFRAMFDTAAPRLPDGVSRPAADRWKYLLASLFCLSGAAFSLLHQGARAELLQLPARVSTLLGDAAAEPGSLEAGAGQTAQTGGDRSGRPGRPAKSTPDASARLIPLPPPDADGLILLDSDGPYAWADVAGAGRLVIRAAEGRRPMIHLAGRPLRVTADRLHIENVNFRDVGTVDSTPVSAPQTSVPEPRTPDPASALLLVQAQQVSIVGCRFESDRFPLTSGDAGEPNAAAVGHSSQDHSSALPPVAVAWKRFDPGDRRGGTLSIEDSVFAHGGTALHLAEPPRELRVVNCLKLGPGPLVDLWTPYQIGGEVSISLSRLTLRESGGLLRFPSEGRRSPPRVVVTAADCLFDLAASRAALFEWVGTSAPPGWQMLLEMTGEGSVAGPGLTVAATVDPADGRTAELDVSELELEGLVVGPFEYQGPFSGDPADSAVTTSRVPRRSPHPPGIDAARLSGW